MVLFNINLHSQSQSVRIEQFRHKADALFYITQGFASYPVYIKKNFDLDDMCGGEAYDKPRLTSLWIRSLKWNGLVSDHKCVPNIIREFNFHAEFKEPYR